MSVSVGQSKTGADEPGRIGIESAFSPSSTCSASLAASLPCVVPTVTKPPGTPGAGGRSIVVNTGTGAALKILSLISRNDPVFSSRLLRQLVKMIKESGNLLQQLFIRIIVAVQI